MQCVNLRIKWFLEAAQIRHKSVKRSRSFAGRADGGDKDVPTTSLLSPPNKPPSRYWITPLKISLIFLLKAIPQSSQPSNWLPSLALVCAGSGVTHNVMAVY
jgi:hypothetical protein